MNSLQHTTHETKLNSQYYLYDNRSAETAAAGAAVQKTVKKIVRRPVTSQTQNWMLILTISFRYGASG